MRHVHIYKDSERFIAGVLLQRLIEKALHRWQMAIAKAKGQLENNPVRVWVMLSGAVGLDALLGGALQETSRFHYLL